MRIRCTTSRSDSLLLVNYHSTYSVETMLTEDSEHTYLQIPLLRQQDNNILVLLARMSMYRDQTLEVLSDWMKPDESLNLYQRLIEDLWLQQTPEQYGLTLIALWCRERLLNYSTDETTQPIEGSYLADNDAILHGEDIKNKRAVFEQIILSLWRVLHALDISEETVQLLGEVLDIKASLQEPLAGIAAQYTVKKVSEHYHNGAFEEASERLLKCAEAMLKRERNADVEWIVIPRLPMQLVSAI